MLCDHRDEFPDQRILGEIGRGLRAESVPVNTLGATTLPTGTGPSYRVPSPGTYEISVEMPVDVAPGWTLVQIAVGSSTHLSGSTSGELNAASGYQRISFQRVVFISDITQAIQLVVQSNVGGTLRSDITMTVRKLPETW